MTDRDRLIEIMARAAYQHCRDCHQLTQNYQWEAESENHRDLWREQQRRVIEVAERAGFRWLGPDDGR